MFEFNHPKVFKDNFFCISQFQKLHKNVGGTGILSCFYYDSCEVDEVSSFNKFTNEF